MHLSRMAQPLPEEMFAGRHQLSDRGQRRPSAESLTVCAAADIITFAFLDSSIGRAIGC